MKEGEVGPVGPVGPTDDRRKGTKFSTPQWARGFHCHPSPKNSPQSPVSLEHSLLEHDEQSVWDWSLLNVLDKATYQLSVVRLGSSSLSAMIRARPGCFCRILINCPQADVSERDIATLPVALGRLGQQRDSNKPSHMLGKRTDSLNRVTLIPAWPSPKSVQTSRPESTHMSYGRSLPTIALRARVRVFGRRASAVESAAGVCREGSRLGDKSARLQAEKCNSEQMPK